MWLPAVVIIYWIALLSTVSLFIFFSFTSSNIMTILLIWTIIAVLSFIVLIDMMQKHKPSHRLFPVIARIIHWHGGHLSSSVFSRHEVKLIDAYAHGEPLIVSFGVSSSLRGPFIRPSFYPSIQAIISPVEVGNSEFNQVISRLNFSALGYGPVSSKMVEALGIAAKQVGCLQNTGEDGISKHHLSHGQTLCLQLGSGYLGFVDETGEIDYELLSDTCRAHNVALVELKLSQGGKPGAGGHLPGAKVSAEMAQSWGVDVGKDVDTPPFHVGVHNASSLIERVDKIRRACRRPVGVKICWGKDDDFEGLLSVGAQKGCLPDFITIDSNDGGSGAADAELMTDVGVPLFHGICAADRILKNAGMRNEVKIISSGGIASGAGLIRALSLGADGAAMARAPMIAAGCVQAARCHNGNCPAGIATSSLLLKAAFDISIAAEQMANLHTGIIESAKRIMVSMGKNDPDQLNMQDLYLD